MNIKQLQNYLDTRLELLNVEFDEDEHTYKCDGDLYTGVTQVCRVNSKSWLHLWTTKENYRYMKENWDLEKEYTEEEKEELLMEAKNAHKTKSEKAQEIGTKIHKWIEDYIKGEEPEMIEGHEKTLNSFKEWEKENNVKWIKSELIVASKKHKVAGTLDGLALVNGELVLIDFKTSKRFNKSAFLQTAAYKMCLEEIGIVPAKRLIVRIPKDEKKVETLEVPTPYDFDKKTFKRLREVYRWNLYVRRQTDYS